MEYLAERITIDDRICNGKPTIRGKRITVQTVLEFLNAGESNEEILHQYPALEQEDIKACLQTSSLYNYKNKLNEKNFIDLNFFWISFYI
jgi:uncharacterized protein (DUF433 family)